MSVLGLLTEKPRPISGSRLVAVVAATAMRPCRLATVSFLPLTSQVRRRRGPSRRSTALRCLAAFCLVGCPCRTWMPTCSFLTAGTEGCSGDDSRDRCGMPPNASGRTETHGAGYLFRQRTVGSSRWRLVVFWLNVAVLGLVFWLTCRDMVEVSPESDDDTKGVTYLLGCGAIHDVFVFDGYILAYRLIV